MTNSQSKIDLLEEQNSKLVLQVDELRKKFAEIEAENIKVKAENAKVKAENIGIKAENTKLKQTLEEHERRFSKLECDVSLIKEQNLQDKDANILQVPVSLQVPIPPEINSDNTSTKDISSHIDMSQLKAESQPNEEEAITPNPMPETVHSSTQSKSLTDPESSITSLPQDIIDDDTAETLDFVETVYKEQFNTRKMPRNFRY
ncbi:hypothetical protein Glove_220g4 [Diversispora epigaea]|uniref:Uncharacterized protein n=1 Tax=Diversispora epigaea TaxID=1348612 RepID=A0A397IIB7_9GLOM|nr:hypothetical protein Glove_220g4 [Diversispora epigaea]